MVTILAAPPQPRLTAVVPQVKGPLNATPAELPTMLRNGAAESVCEKSTPMVITTPALVHCRAPKLPELPVTMTIGPVPKELLLLKLRIPGKPALVAPIWVPPVYEFDALRKICPPAPSAVSVPGPVIGTLTIMTPSEPSVAFV